MVERITLSGLLLAAACGSACSVDPTGSPEDATESMQADASCDDSQCGSDGTSSVDGTSGPSSTGPGSSTDSATGPQETTQGSSSGGQSTSTGASDLACDPLDAGCVGCADVGCEETCCYVRGVPSCEPYCRGSDALPVQCDGPEDCAGGQCCVSANIGLPDGATTYGVAHCTPTPPCNIRNQLLAGQWRLRSVACHSDRDCIGIVDSFYPEEQQEHCCRNTDFDVGACVDTAAAFDITNLGGSCG